MRSSKNQRLALKIQNANGKPKIALPKDIQGQLEVVYRKKSYFLKKSESIYSGYLQGIWHENNRKVEITEQLELFCGCVEDKRFQNILLIIQGNQLQIDKAEIGVYWNLAQFLQMETILPQIKEDIIKNIEDYNIFMIFGISQQFSDQELFELCHEQLYKQQFEQISYHEYEFLHLKLSLFRLIMKMHNKYKLENGIEPKHLEIDAIIKRYCELNHLAPDIQQTLKLQLIDLKSLSSKDYKRIFLDHSFNPHFHYTPDHHLSTEMRLSMENTFQRKRNNQLTIQNNNLGSQLLNLKNQTAKNIGFQGQMERDLKMLRNEMNKKQEENLQLKKLVSKYQSMLEYMQNQLQQKTTDINGLVSKFEQLKPEQIKDSPLQDKAEQSEANTIVQSQYLPSYFIQEIMAQHKKQSENAKQIASNRSKCNPSKVEQEIEMIL